jgi:hypothetical protein
VPEGWLFEGQWARSLVTWMWLYVRARWPLGQANCHVDMVVRTSMTENPHMGGGFNSKHGSMYLCEPLCTSHALEVLLWWDAAIGKGVQQQNNARWCVHEAAACSQLRAF